MKRLLLLLFLAGSFVRAAQAQSCEEALAYYVSSSPSGEGDQWMARTGCAAEADAVPLMAALREQGVGEFVWSAANQSVAYGFGTIYTLTAADTTPLPALAETETSFYHSPMWSPDGAQLVAVETNPDEAVDWLVATDLAGSLRRIAQLTSSPEDESLILPLRWSPDGQWISYALSHRVDSEDWETNIVLLSTGCISDPAQTCEAHELAITDDSGERPNVQTDSQALLPEHWWGMAWSPDSQQLAFLCSANDFCLLYADGTNFRRAPITLHGNSLAWSPSGTYLAYQADSDIYLYDIEQDTHTNVTQSPDLMEFVPLWILLPEGAFLLEAP